MSCKPTVIWGILNFYFELSKAQKLMKKLLSILIATSLGFAPLANACTSFLLSGNDGGYVYGRTMEFGLPLKSQLMTVPRNIAMLGVGVDGKPGTGRNWTTKYATVGMNGLGLPILVDGMNEKGLVGGLLNAPNTAVFQAVAPEQSANSISSAQILTYALTNFATVEEVKVGLKSIMVNRSTIPQFGNKTAPIHMTLHDAKGKSIAVEYIQGQLQITDNPTHVMTNDPVFADHLASIGNYANLSPVEKDPLVINGTKFYPPSTGSGLHGLPGDYLSTSRFIRAVFLSKSVPTTHSTERQINSAWHILGSFDIPPGAVQTVAGSAYGGSVAGIEVTEWSAVADNKNMTYFIKMYDNSNVQKFDMKKMDINAKEIKYINVDKPQTYIQLN